MIKDFSIDTELDAMSYDYLLQNAPRLLRALERDVAGGRTPEQVRARVLERTSRLELALRCEQAARHMTGLNV